MTQPFVYPEASILTRLTLWTKDPKSANNENANMTFAEKGKNFEILVWPRNADEKGKGPIRGNLHPFAMLSLADFIDSAANNGFEKHVDFGIKNSRKNPEDPDGKREVYDQSVFRVARNADGVIFFGLFDRDETRSRILFPLMLDTFTGPFRKDGNELEANEISEMMARNYAKVLRHRALLMSEGQTETQKREAAQNRQAASGGSKPQAKASSGFDTDFADIGF